MFTSLLVATLVVLNVALSPFFVYLLVVALASLRSGVEPGRGDPRSRFLIVVPARDAEATIAATVRNCLASDYPRALFDVMVIAENCVDQTAATAAEAGADVVERGDEQGRGRGFALQYLVQALAPSRHLDDRHAVLMIDSGSELGPDVLRKLDRRLRSGLDWIQCRLAIRDPDRSWKTRVETLASSLSDGVLPLGRSLLGSSASFRGVGMCFSTRGMKRVPWRPSGPGDEADYSWTLRIAGERIAFEPDATVQIEAPSGNDEAEPPAPGRFRRYSPLILGSPHMTAWDKLLSLLELVTPSMAQLAALYLIATFLNGWQFAAYFGRRDGYPLFFLASSCLMSIALALYAVAPFLALGLPWRFASSLAFFPFYMLWKLAVARKGPPKSWVRTEREPAQSPDARAGRGGG